MTSLIKTLWNDENGFIVSAELVLIATILIVGLVVGLAEVSHAVNNELEDVASAFGSMNQSFYVKGLHSDCKGSTPGSGFHDEEDLCDSQYDIVGTRVHPEF